MSYLERVKSPGPKRLLALDGGGIRGVIAIEILGVLEEKLRAATGGRPDFVLADYFDYVAGTSTGAIIATCIAKGFAVAKMRRFFEEGARSLLVRAPIWDRLKYQYLAEGLVEKLQEELGEQTLGDPSLRTLLMMVLRNADTDSPWPLSNNPLAKYNERSRTDCNLDFPLWQIIRASTAAPTYFRHEEIEIKGEARKFVDGAVSVYNNPAFLLYLMATLPEYRLRWATGEEQMLLVSVGTGSLMTATKEVKASQMTLLYNARHIPSVLLNAASIEQDTLCRVVGRCRFGGHIDGEIGDLMTVDSDEDASRPRSFTYARYNPELTQKALESLHLLDVDARSVEPLLSVAHVKELRSIGTAYAEECVKLEHFGAHVPRPDIASA